MFILLEAPEGVPVVIPEEDPVVPVEAPTIALVANPREVVHHQEAPFPVGVVILHPELFPQGQEEDQEGARPA